MKNLKSFFTKIGFSISAIFLTVYNSVLAVVALYGIMEEPSYSTPTNGFFKFIYLIIAIILGIIAILNKKIHKIIKILMGILAILLLILFIVLMFI